MPRCLLEKPYPPNLLTIPSCCECNTGFKQDEEYFLAVMAQSGFAPTLMSKVDENRAVDRMLQKSPGLDTLIQGSLHAAEDGRVYITPEPAHRFGLVLLEDTPPVVVPVPEIELRSGVTLVGGQPVTSAPLRPRP